MHWEEFASEPQTLDIVVVRLRRSWRLWPDHRFHLDVVLVRRQVQDDRPALLPGAGLMGVFGVDGEGYGLSAEDLTQWLSDINGVSAAFDHTLTGIY